jgi:hypothetical protein
MSDNGNLAAVAAKTAGAYTWLLADVLIFFVLSVCLLAYKDFDEPMRVATRVLLVVLLAQLWVSSVHILAFMRSGKLPWYRSYGFKLAKLGILIAAAWWLWRKGLL